MLQKCFTKIAPEIYQELLDTKFTFRFFRWELSPKNQVHGAHDSQLNIILKRMIILNQIFVYRI